MPNAGKSMAAQITPGDDALDLFHAMCNWSSFRTRRPLAKGGSALLVTLPPNTVLVSMTRDEALELALALASAHVGGSGAELLEALREALERALDPPRPPNA
jgi:hypothetical protein